MRYRDDWNELARREPYFAVLTEERFLREHLDDDARRAFFATGEADVDELLAMAGVAAPENVLDFGCGVGRLTLAFARRAAHAVGCDISPEMTAEAEQNARRLGVANATFVTSLDHLRGRQFDLICSLIVFQHIPVDEGYATLSRLLEMLAPGGVVAIHFTLRRPGSPLRRLARRLRGAFPVLHRVASRVRGDRLRLPYMQMNTYDRAEIVRRIAEATGAPPRVIPRPDGEIEGALFLARRSHDAAPPAPGDASSRASAAASSRRS